MSACAPGPWQRPCISTALCRLQELARSSLWSEVAQTVEDIEASWCVAGVMQKAMEEEQWQCVWRLAAHCSVQQREVLVQQAASRGQWQCVTDMVKMGVGPTVRHSLLTQAVAGRHVACAAGVMSVGVCRQHTQDSLTQAMEASHWDFIVELVKTCSDPDLCNLVVKEAMKKECWQVVWGMVRQGLTVGVIESVCDEAVSCRQWDLVLYLLQQGLSASEWIIDQLFRDNMAQSLLDSFDPGSLSDGLKGLLLMVGVCHGQGDITLQIVEREKVSDAELMEAMKHAVHLLDAKVFLKLLRHSPRSRRVFKQKFHQQHWKESFVVCGPDGDVGDGGEVTWIFRRLMEEGEHELALHVANIRGSLVYDFYKASPSTFDLKKEKFRKALRRLYEDDPYCYGEMTQAMYQKSKAARSFLLRQAVRLGELSLVCRFCEQGVGRGDLKFAVPWLVLSGDTESSDALRFLHSRLPRKDRTWFDRYAAKCSLREYFKEKSNSKLKTFIGLFRKCKLCNKDKAFCCQVFRSAVVKAVKVDDAYCFVKVYKCHLSSNSCLEYDLEQKEDCRFGFLKVIQAGRKHFIDKLYQTKFSRTLYVAKDLMILVEVVFETQVFDVLLHLYDHMYPGSMPVSKEGYEPLSWCLKKMLNEGHTWTGLAPILEHWIRTTRFNRLFGLLLSVRGLILQGHQTFDFLGIAQWSLEQHFCNLAFVLALMIGEWNLMETVLAVEDVVINESILCYALSRAGDKCLFAVGALILKICPVNTHTLRQAHLSRGHEEIAGECKKLGLLDWAVALSMSNLIRCRNQRNVINQLQACSNQVVLDYCMERAVSNKWWVIVSELMTRCDNKSILEKALKKSVTSGQSEIAEAIIGQVDPTVVRENKYDFYFGKRVCKTLLHLAVVKTKSMKMICLLIASGLSTMQRDVTVVQSCSTGDHNCPVLYSLFHDKVPVIKLLLKCGVLTHKRLHEIRTNSEMRRRLRSRNGHVGEKWKEGYRCILSAAATPLRLDHMARLVVSHMIGCRPGRADRIERLPVAPGIKSLIHFRDVVSATEEEEVAMDQSETA